MWEVLNKNPVLVLAQPLPPEGESRQPYNQKGSLGSTGCGVHSGILLLLLHNGWTLISVKRVFGGIPEPFIFVIMGKG